MKVSYRFPLNVFKRNITTHFGYKDIDISEKQNEVNKVFSNVAKKYDKMNDAMSFGVHRLWKNTFVNRMNPKFNETYLDLAGGTGDIAFRIADQMAINWINSGRKDQFRLNSNSRIIISDINQNMIDEGKKRALKLQLSFDWIVSDASNLPLESNIIDCVSISFGLRNCADPILVLKEALRVLKPGGRFMCLEFSNVDNKYLSKLYDIYSFNVIPVMGAVIAGDWNSYQYLVESIRVFYNKNELADIMKSIGFIDVQFDNIFSGIVCIHEGYKPL